MRGYCRMLILEEGHESYTPRFPSKHCFLIIAYLVGGWAYPSEQYELVSWDDSSQYMENQKMFQTTNQL